MAYVECDGALLKLVKSLLRCTCPTEMLSESCRRILVSTELNKVGYISLDVQILVNANAPIGACRQRVYCGILKYDPGKIRR